MMQPLNRHVVGLCSAFALVLLAGCSKAPGDISGKITVGGKPVTAGTITFYDEKNHTSSSPITDGSYSVKKVAAGNVKVAITGPIDIAMVSPVGGAQTTITSGKKGGPAIPPKYADQEKSGLDFEVKSGSQTKDFDLTP